MAYQAAQDSISLQARIRGHIRYLQWAVDEAKSKIHETKGAERERLESALAAARAELEKVLT